MCMFHDWSSLGSFVCDSSADEDRTRDLPFTFIFTFMAGFTPDENRGSDYDFLMCVVARP
jgi:hypothetical protein